MKIKRITAGFAGAEKHKAPPKRGLIWHQDKFAVTRPDGQPKLDLNAGATGDTKNIVYHHGTFKSQSQPSPDTISHGLERCGVQHSHIVDALAIGFPREQKP